jgi:hypothetical protein
MMTTACNYHTKELTSITILSNPSKMVYTIGETFDATGMEIQAVYSDASTAVVTTYTTSPSTALKLKNTTIVISYTEGEVTKTVDLHIIVDEVVMPTKVLDSIAITTPNKIQYFVGDTLVLTDLIVTANYTDASFPSETVTTYTTTPSAEKLLATSNTSVTVSYTLGDVTKIDSFNIIVSPLPEKDIERISIATTPKLTYTAGEEFDVSSLKVVIEYTDDYYDEKDITKAVTFKIGEESIEEGYVFTTVNTQGIEVTIKYTDDKENTYTTEFIIIIVAPVKTIAKIEIESEPDNTSIGQGKNFDVTGIKVVVVYEGDHYSNLDVTNAVKFAIKGEEIKDGDQMNTVYTDGVDVTVTYMDEAGTTYTTTFRFTVVAH